MAGLNGEKALIIGYDAAIYDFVSPIKAALGLTSSDDLSKLHQHDEYRIDDVVTRETDSRTPAHERYYQNIGETGFYDTYARFVRNVVARMIDDSLIVQRVPSFRVHMPGNKAVGEYHRDRDFGHQPGAINFWVPETDAHGTNSVHFIFEEGQRPMPMTVDVGEALVSDTVNLLHGNELNQTDETRVSFDFRVIPERDYVESAAASVNTGTPLVLGGYYVRAGEL